MPSSCISRPDHRTPLPIGYLGYEDNGVRVPATVAPRASVPRRIPSSGLSLTAADGSEVTSVQDKILDVLEKANGRGKEALVAKAAKEAAHAAAQAAAEEKARLAAETAAAKAAKKKGGKKGAKKAEKKKGRKGNKGAGEGPTEEETAAAEADAKWAAT